MFILLLLLFLCISAILPALFRLKGVLLAHAIITVTIYLLFKPNGTEFAHQVGTAEMGSFVGPLFFNFFFLPVTMLTYWLTDD